MRRLLILLDLAVARGPGLEAALRQLAIAIARVWGVWHRPDLTWGYSLYDSTCPDLLLRDSLRKAASSLKLPPAFHDATATDLRSSDLQLFLSLVKKVTGLPAGSAAAGQGEAPVRALVSALQAALGSSFLRKLAEVAENSSGSGSSAEGLVLLFSPALTSQSSLLSFLGVPASEAACTTQAEVEALLAKHVPATALQRCQECCSRLAWVGMAFSGEPAVPAGEPAEEQMPAASAGATPTHSRRPRRSGSRAATPATSTAAAAAPAVQAAVHGPEILAALQAVLAQGGAPAAACELPQLAAPDCSPAGFAALLGLPPTAQGEVRTAAGSEQQQQQQQQQTEEGSMELSLDVWPGDEESLDEVLDRLPSLLLHLDPEGRRGSDDIRRVVMRRHREQQRAAQHKGRGAALPAAAALRRSALPVPRAKGQAAVQQAQKLHAQKENRRNGSQPNTAATSMLGGPSPAKAVEPVQEEEVESGAAMSLDEAAAELARRLEDLIPQEGEVGPPNPAEMALKIKHQMVDPLFAAVRRHYSQQQEQQEEEEGEAPPSMDHIRSVLLSRGAAPAALLKVEYSSCKEEAQQLRFQHKAVAQVLLRLHICGAGVGNGQELPQGQEPEVEGLLQLVNGILHPITKAGHEFFTTVVRPNFGAKFPGPLQRLAQELWEEEVELDFDPNAMWDLALARDIGMEVSGETPGTNQQQPSNSAAAGTGGATVSGNPQRSGSVRTNDTGGRPGPSNLGLLPPMALHRELSMREIVTSTRPSVATGAGGGSQSKFSGDNSGVHTGSAGGGSQRGATSKGLGNQHQLRLRALALGRNDSWAFAAQRQDKKPATRGTGRRPHQQVASRGAATLAKAQQQQQRPSGKAAQQGAGKGAAAADQAGGARPRGARPNVPDTPESHLKMLPQALQQQQKQQQKQQVGVQGSSPPIVSPPVMGLGPAEEVPNTDARPGLLSPPSHLAALRKAPPSRQLQFRGGNLLASGAPGVIPSSLPEDLEPEVQKKKEEAGGSKTASPVAPAGPTWLVAAAQPVRGPVRRPAVPPFLQAQQQGARPAAPQQQQQQQSQPSQQLAGYSDLPAGEALDDAPSPYGAHGGLDEVPSSPEQPAAAGQGQAPGPDLGAARTAPTSALTAADVAVYPRVAPQGTVVKKGCPAAVAGPQEEDQPAEPPAENEGQAAAAVDEHTAESRQDSVLRLRGGGSGQRSGNSRKWRQRGVEDEEGKPAGAGAQQQQQEAAGTEECAAPNPPPAKRAAAGSAAARRKAASSQDVGSAGAAGPASASTRRTTRSRAATQGDQQELAGGEAAPAEEAVGGAAAASVPSMRMTRAAAVSQATPGNGVGAAGATAVTPASVKPTARSADSRRSRGRAQQQQQQQQGAQQGEQEQQVAEASDAQKASAAEQRRSRSRSRSAAAEQSSEQPSEPQVRSKRATRSTPLPDKAMAQDGLEVCAPVGPQGQQAVSRRSARSTPLAETAAAAGSGRDLNAPAASQGQQPSGQPAAGRRATRTTLLPEAAAVADTGREAGSAAAAKEQQLSQQPVAGRRTTGSAPLPSRSAAAADSGGAGRDARADGASATPQGEQASEQLAGSMQGTGAGSLPTGQGGTPAAGTDPGIQVNKYKAEIVGRRVEVLLKDGAYHQATIKSYHSGRHKLLHDDGTSKHYYLFKDQYRFLDSVPPALVAAEQAAAQPQQQQEEQQQQQQGVVLRDAGGEQGAQGEAGEAGARLEAAVAQRAEQSSRRQAGGAAKRGARQTPAKRQAAGPPDAEAAPIARRSRVGTPAGAVAAASPAAAEEGQQPEQQLAGAEARPGAQQKAGKKTGKRGAKATQQQQQNVGEEARASSASPARDQVMGGQGGEEQQPQAAPLSGLLQLGCASCPAGKKGCSACCATAQQALSNAGLGFLLQLGFCSSKCSKLPNCHNCWMKVAFMLDHPNWMEDAHCDSHTVYCSTCSPCRAAAAISLGQHKMRLQGCGKCCHGPKGCKQCCGKLQGIMTQVAAYAAAHGAAVVVQQQQQQQQEQPAAQKQPAPAQQARPAKARGKQRKGSKRGRGSEQPAAELASEAAPAQAQREAGAAAEMAAAREQPEAQQQQQQEPQPVLRPSIERAEGEQAQQHEAQQEQQPQQHGGDGDSSPVAKKPRVSASQATGKGKTPRRPGLMSRMLTQAAGSNEDEVEQRPTTSRRLGSSAQRATSAGARGSRGAAPSAVQQQQPPSTYSGAYDIPGSPTTSAGGSIGGAPGAQQGLAAGGADAAMTDAAGAPAALPAVASPAAPAMSTPWSSKRGSEEQPGSEEVLSQYTSRRSGGSVSMSLSPGGDELDSRPNPGAAGAAGAAAEEAADAAAEVQGAGAEGAAGGLGAEALQAEAVVAHPAAEAEGMEVEEQAGESGLPWLSPCEEDEGAAPAVAAAEPMPDMPERQAEGRTEPAAAAAPAAAGALPQLSPFEGCGMAAEVAEGGDQAKAAPAGRLTEGKAAAAAAEPAVAEEASPRDGAEAGGTPGSVERVHNAQPPPASLQHHQLTAQHLRRDSVDSQALLPMTQQQAAAAAAAAAKSPQASLTPRRLFNEREGGLPVAAGPRWQPVLSPHLPLGPTATATSSFASSPGGGLGYAAGPQPAAQGLPALRQQQGSSAAAGRTPLKYHPSGNAGLPLLSQDLSQGAARLLDSQPQPCPYSPSLMLQHPELTNSQLQEEFQQQQQQLGRAVLRGDAGSVLASPPPQVFPGAAVLQALSGLPMFPARGDLLRHISKKNRSSPSKEARLLVALSAEPAPQLGSRYRTVWALLLDRSFGAVVTQETLSLDVGFRKAGAGELEKGSDWAVEGCLTQGDVDLLVREWEQHCESYHGVHPAMLPPMPLPQRLQRSIHLLFQGPAPLVL